MMFKLDLVVIFVICYYTYFEVVVGGTSSHSPGKDGKRTFTDEWQEIGNDEAIPPGLHIRINLTTGKREAKLLEKEENTKTSLAVVEEGKLHVSEKDEKYHLKERLKNIQAEELAPTVEEIENIKKKFRTYEELKNEFESLKLAVKTDLQVMDELFASYQKVMDKRKEQTIKELENLNILSPVEESHLSILTDLEYMVHQVDNAREFVLSNGLKLIVYPSLNSTSSVIRTEAARLLGSAVQNNAASQIKAVESGAVDTLLRVLALDSAASVRSAALYALSCLVRRFPLAQRQFVDQGGLAVLASMFNGDSGEQLKLQVKIVTFVSDLLTERKDAGVTQQEIVADNVTLEDVKSVEREEAEERVRQYQLVDLNKTLQEQQWCQHLVKLFKQELLSKSTSEVTTVLTGNSVHSPDLDVVEKLTRAMLSLIEPCQEDFLTDSVVPKLTLQLIQWLKKLALHEQEEADGYYTDLADQVKVLGSRLGIFHTTHPLPDFL